MENGISYTPRREGFWSFDVGDRILDLSDTLLPIMTQDQSAVYISPNGFSTCTAEQFFLIGDKMYELRNSGGKDGELVESAREFIKKGIRRNRLNTQTRIAYSPEDQDKIIQGYRTPRAVSRKVNFLGPSGSPDIVLSLKASLALTGKSPEEVNTIMSFLNDTASYVLIVNSKPQSVDERAVGFVASSGMLYFYCCGILDCEAFSG